MLKTRRHAAVGGALVLALVGFAAAVATTPGCFIGIDEGLLRGDAAASSDARAFDAGAGEPATVPCGATACEPPVSVCCASSFGDTDFRRGACATRESCKTGDYFACTRPRDCGYAGSAGARCCVVRLSGGAFTSTRCAATCDADDGLCGLGDGADDTGGCMGGRTCRASLEFPSLYQCQ